MLPSLSRMRTLCARISATSPSSRNMKRRVTGSSAATSEATKFSSSPSPMTTGQPSRARMMRSGSCSLTTASAYAPSSSATVARTALNRSSSRWQVIVDAVRDDFGVGLGGELVAARFELLAQLFVVLDDAVVDDREAVARDVRMRVALARHAVRGPAGVRDAE